jgi:hypothetical protein
MRDGLHAQHTEKHQQGGPDDEGDVGNIADEQAVVVDEVHDVATSETGLSCDSIAEMGHGASEKKTDAYRPARSAYTQGHQPKAGTRGWKSSENGLPCSFATRCSRGCPVKGTGCRS